MINDYRQAIEILCQANKFDRAIDVLERYNTLTFDESQLNEIVIPPKATRTIDRLCFDLAKEHYKNNKFSDMEDVLGRLPKAQDRIEFLKNRGFYDKVAKALEESGKPEEAAQLLMEYGKFKEASQLSSEPKFVADCFMALARTVLLETPNDSEIALEHLEVARMKYEEAGDNHGLGDALLQTGKVQKNVDVVKNAGRVFNKARNDVGEAETVETLFEITNDKDPNLQPWILVRTVQRLLVLILTLAKQDKLRSEEYKMTATCERHFGLRSSSDSQAHLIFLHNNGCRFSTLKKQSEEGQMSEEIEQASAHKIILRFLATLSVKLVRKIRCLLQNFVAQNSVCREFHHVSDCRRSSCISKHTNDSRQLFNYRFLAALNLVFLDAVVSGFVKSVSSIEEAKPLIDRLMTKDIHDFESCKTLYGIIFPEVGMQGVSLTPRHLIEIGRASCRERV